MLEIYHIALLCQGGYNGGMKNKGLLFALAAMLISGVSVFANAQLVKGMDPILQTTIKNGLVGLLIIGWMVVNKKITALKRLGKGQWTRLGIIALLGGSVSFGLYFTGLKMIGGVDGSLIQKSMVLWISLLAAPLLKEKVLSWFTLAAAGLFAVNFIGGTHLSSLGLGHALVLIATLCWSVEAILVKRFMTDIDVDILLFGRMVLGSALLMVYAGVTGKFALMSHVSTAQWQGLLLVSLTLFGYVMMWYRAVKEISPVVVSSILVGAVIITTALTSIVGGKVALIDVEKALLISGLISGLLLYLGRLHNRGPVLSETHSPRLADKS